MILMQLNDISKSFGAEEILTDIKMEIKTNERIAVVGRNGTGKSTLLKIITGEMPYDTGELIQRKNLSIGYLSQHTTLDSEETIWEEMLEVYRPLIEQGEKLAELEKQMEHAGELASREYESLLESYDALQQSFDANGGYHYEADIRAVLTGLNFPESMHHTSIATLSGGQKTRLALGKLLLTKPELLVLDEPTNHLDIDTLGWLENYLVNYPGSIVMVSHDRYFLDRTISIVYELSRNHIKKYHGTYTRFLEQKAADFDKEMKEYEKQQAEIQKMEEFIQRNIARASTTKRAQDRRKKLEKMDKIKRPEGDEASLSFTFQEKRQSGGDVLTITDLAFGYENTGTPLFSNVHLQVHRGDRIALVGPNGVGKTTLLKLITGALEPAKGTIQHGTNVEIGYYDQELGQISSAKTVLHELWDEYPHIDEKDIRAVLGNFLFTGDDVLKTVDTLSGGERARLALSKLRMQQANLLILDEPTNHLDLDSKEVLEAALMGFPGTIIFVSHDRYFINKITDQVIEMQADGVKHYLGDYDYYVAKKAEEAEIRRLQDIEKQKNEPSTTSKSAFQADKEAQNRKRRNERKIVELENTISERETELAELEREMAEPEVYQDHEKALAYTRETNALEKEIEQLMEDWASLQDS